MTLGRVAYQGAPGAFSEAACLALAVDFEPTGFARFSDVFEALATGACPRAVLPTHNSLAGAVPEVAAWLPTSDAVVLDTRELPIRLMLLGVGGSSLGDVKSVESHPMALKQCQGFIIAHRLEAREVYDTAGAAQIVAAANDPSRGAVASGLAGERYGLRVLAEGIEDAQANRTHFVLLRRG